MPLVRDGWKLINPLQEKPEQYLTKHIFVQFAFNSHYIAVFIYFI